MAANEKTEAEKLAAMLAIHAELTRHWKESKFYAGQEDWIKRTIFPLKLVVDSALFMGLGSIAGDSNGSWKYDSGYPIGNLVRLTQVVAFECWIDILSNHPLEEFSGLAPSSLKKIDLKFAGQKFDIPAGKVYFQEPAFIDIEKHFIGSLGHTVIEHPQAYQILTRRTFLCSSYLFKDIVASCFNVAMPDLAVMSPLWVDSWLTYENLLPDRVNDYTRMKRSIRRYVKSHLRQKQGPLFERIHDRDESTLVASLHETERLMHSWLQDSEWYWSPDDLSVIGDVGQPMHQQEWRFLPGLYGITNTFGGGDAYVERQLKEIKKEWEISPPEEITSGSESEFEKFDEENEEEKQELEELPSSKSIPRSPSARGRERRLQRLRKLRVYRIGNPGLSSS